MKNSICLTNLIDSFKDFDNWIVERKCDKIERVKDKFGLMIDQDICLRPEKNVYGPVNLGDQTVCLCFSDLCNNSETNALKIKILLCTLAFLLFHVNIGFVL